MLSIFNRTSIYSLLAELVVIVVGVLIAIAIDAWIQNLQDSELEQEALASLLTDLERAEEIANEMVQRDEAIINAAIEATENGALGLRGQRGSGLQALFATVPSTLRLRTYDELTATGNLRLISDRELRLLLTDFDSQARTLEGYDNQLETQWNETSRPLLYKVIQFELFRFNEEPRTNNEEFMQPADHELVEMYHAIIDRGNFAAVHLGRTQELLALISELQYQTGISLDAAP